jgi:hypothetical protein
MHACPDGNLATSIHVDKNLLLCGTDEPPAFTPKILSFTQTVLSTDKVRLDWLDTPRKGIRAF